MELKDFNIFNLSLQQKKLLKKKIGQGGGSTSDDGIPIFYVSEKINTIVFKLMQGKPKTNEWGDLEPIICIDAFSNNCVFNATILPEGFSLTKLDTLNLTVINYYCENDYVSDFLALNVGDSLTIDKSELSIHRSFTNVTLTSDKDFDTTDSFYLEDLGKITVSYSSVGAVWMMGRVIKVDETNHNLYLSIGGEIWKYNYIGNHNQLFTNITFVEVVQP